MKKIFFLFFLSILSSAAHLQFSRIVVKPDKAELISIINTTNSTISLEGYYISDSENYYKIQTNNDLSPGHMMNDFMAKFPDGSEIPAGDSINIAIHPDYQEIYNDNLTIHYNLQTDLIETEPGSLGLATTTETLHRLDDSQECIILFKWDNDLDHAILDIDYFLWGGTSYAINKSGIDGYSPDTEVALQDYFQPIHDDYSSFIRTSYNENEEPDGNGFDGHDETSEKFNLTWEIAKSSDIDAGCTNPSAINYNSDVEFDDGSCLISYEEILSGEYTCSVVESRDACVNGEPTPDCPIVQIQGTLISFGDYRLKSGPCAFKAEDEENYRLELTIWPNTWDITIDSTYSYLTYPPYYDYLVQARGNVFEYYGNQQVYICGPDNIEVINSYNLDGVFNSEDIINASINPAPYVIIPSLGETLDFTYSVPSNSRAIIRIFDISGNFITSLEDKFFEESGTVTRVEKSSSWHGRDHLGQMVNPGTYLMHLEATNYVTGVTQTDIKPIIVGVKAK